MQLYEIIYVYMLLFDIYMNCNRVISVTWKEWVFNYSSGFVQTSYADLILLLLLLSLTICVHPPSLSLSLSLSLCLSLSLSVCVCVLMCMIWCVWYIISQKTTSDIKTFNYSRV